MKKLYTFNNISQAEILKSMLSSENIETYIKNKHIQSLLGQIPFTEGMPEIWILNDEAYEKSQNILNDFLKANENNHLSEWRCSHCDEINESQFYVCWNCGKEIKK